MKETWEKFEDWLSINWPDGLSALNPPATDAQIAELENKLAVKLPADFIACLKVHNGQNGYSSIFEGGEFLSCADIFNQWSVWKGLLDGGDFEGISSEPQLGIKDDWWNAKWIPFTHNGCGDHLCLDLDPAASGAVGQIITMWHDEGSRAIDAQSFSAYFTTYVADVIAGQYVYSDEYGGLVAVEDLD
jgi:cell wall assembly regulator SMI1